MNTLTRVDTTTTLTDLPDSAHVWLFHCDRDLSDAESQVLSAQLTQFVNAWAAHGVELVAAAEVLYNRFIVIAVDKTRVPPSGCSIDTLMRELTDISVRMHVQILDAPDICYRDAHGAIQSVTRRDFGSRVGDTTVNADTIVFDETITVLGDVRSGRWELPARDSWHRAAFNM